MYILWNRQKCVCTIIYFAVYKLNWCGPYFFRPKIDISPKLGCKTRVHCVIIYQSSLQKKRCGMSNIQYPRDNNRYCFYYNKNPQNAMQTCIMVFQQMLYHFCHVWDLMPKKNWKHLERFTKGLNLALRKLKQLLTSILQ